jgi:phage terminase Nu1 subunit (DNA packaging protein)
MPEVVSKAEFPHRLGVSKARVSQYCGDGLPVRPDGRIDLDRATAWVRNNVLNTEANGFSPMGQDHARERARLMRAKASMAELELARLRRELLPADEVEAGWAQAIGRSRALLLGIPPGVSGEIVMLVRGEPDDDLADRLVRERLTRDIDAALSELADTSADGADDDDDDGNAG